MTLRRIIANGLVVIVALAMGLVLCEAGARLLLNPADHLSATTVQDDTLGIRIEPGRSGFDAWGFRNPKVPTSAEIVAIGDSHTYGNNATMADAWPSVVARLTGRSTYNLGLGGYGPNQYYHLFTTRALALKPRWVVCGLYFGDDFENAFLMTYGRDHWSSLRQGHWEGVEANIWETPPPAAGLAGIRLWLSRHSLVYRLAVHGPLLVRLKGAVQIRQAARRDEGVTSLILPELGIEEAFRPIAIRDRLQQKNAAVREGMRITFELLERMNRDCEAQGCQLVVVLIPTKELVFAEYLLRQPQLRLRDVVEDVIAHEAQARQRVVEFLGQNGILYVDALPLLRARAGDRLYVSSDRDMHPGPNGYRVIGEAVAAFLKDR